MLDHITLVIAMGLVTLAAPSFLFIVLGVSSLLDRRLGEDATSRLCQAMNVIGLLASLTVLTLMLVDNTRYESIELGEWVAIPHYHFSLKLVFDRLSVPFVILTFVLCGTIGAFASRYMHRESGYNRFFVLYALFTMGMVLTSLAGTIETLFAGWEFVGLSSVLLVAFFQERTAPAQNGLWVWVIYRISDAALLLAALVMHHLRGEGDFNGMLGGDAWPEGHAVVSDAAALSVGLLLIVAAIGKSALTPFSGWLPRAMEGPTPSSAIFYGALSVHLGAFILLRVSPLLDESYFLSAVVVIVGLATAIHAYVVGKVQTDIKSALCYASLVQVGLIVAEIGIGLRYLALIHLLGNACLRTLQLVRAPSLLQDYHLLENAIGDHLSQGRVPTRWAPSQFHSWLYRFALERGYFDILFAEWFATPFVRLFLWFDRLEERFTTWLSGGAPSHGPTPTGDRFEELP